MEHEQCCNRRTRFQYEKCPSLQLSKQLCVSSRPTPAPVPQLSPAGLWIPSWNLSRDTAGTKIHHRMLKHSTGACSWQIIKQSPSLRLCGCGLCCLCSRNWLTAQWEWAHISSSGPSSPHFWFSQLCFHTSWREQSLFLHRCSPSPQDGFRNKSGKVNHPQTSQAFVCAPLDVPLPLIIPVNSVSVMLPCKNHTAVLQQTHHSLRSTLASFGSRQTPASHRVSEPALPPARSLPGHCARQAASLAKSYRLPQPHGHGRGDTLCSRLLPHSQACAGAHSRSRR